MDIQQDIRHFFKNNFFLLLDDGVSFFKPKVFIINVTLSFNKKHNTSRCSSNFLKFDLFFSLFSIMEIYKNGGGYYSEECYNCDKFNFYGTWETHITSLISHELGHLFTFYFDLLKTPTKVKKYHTAEWKKNYEIIKNLSYKRKINKDTRINNKFIFNKSNSDIFEIIFIDAT